MVLKINYQRILKSKASILVSIFFLSIFFFNSFCFAADPTQESAVVSSENVVTEPAIKHKFLKLDVLPSNKAPKTDDKFDVVLEGVLRSDSGFQKERLRVFLDDSLISSPEDFMIQTLAKDNRIRFTFAKSDLSYKAKAANLIKVKFLDTELAGNVLAEREIPVFFKPRDTFETSPAFAGFFDTQKIVALKVEIYDDAASAKQFEPKHRLARVRFALFL
jgi:hypothetical protein